jgi:hypothetical protein
LGHRDIPRVGLDRRQPLVHRNDRLRRVIGIREQGDAAAPEELVSGRPVLALEPGPNRVRPVHVVEGTGIGAADVDDRDLIQVRSLVDRAAAVCARQRGLVGDGAGRLRLVVDVASADLVVDVDELRSRDLSRHQGLPAVFDSGRVPRPAGEVVARTAAEDVDHVVLE